MFLFLDGRNTAILRLGLSEESGFSEVREETPLSTSFFKILDDFLISRSLQGKDLKGICMVCGPGSFTSLRVSCAAVLGLHHAWNIPVGGWSVFDLLSSSHFPFVCPDQSTWVGQISATTFPQITPPTQSWTAFEEDLPALRSFNVPVTHQASLFCALQRKAFHSASSEWPSPIPFYIRPHYAQPKP